MHTVLYILVPEEMSEKDWVRGPLWKEIHPFLDYSPEPGNGGALAL